MLGDVNPFIDVVPRRVVDESDHVRDVGEQHLLEEVGLEVLVARVHHGEQLLGRRGEDVGSLFQGPVVRNDGPLDIVHRHCDPAQLLQLGHVVFVPLPASTGTCRGSADCLSPPRRSSRRRRRDVMLPVEGVVVEFVLLILLRRVRLAAGLVLGVTMNP